MGIIILKLLELKAPALIAAWPEIGNVGMLAIYSLRRQLGAEKIGELEPGEFSFLQRVNTQGGVITGLDYPRCDFYCYRSDRQDLAFFFSKELDNTFAQIYRILPLEIKDKLEQRKHAPPETAGEITREESDWLKSHIGDLFKPLP